MTDLVRDLLERYYNLATMNGNTDHLSIHQSIEALTKSENMTSNENSTDNDEDNLSKNTEDQNKIEYQNPVNSLEDFYVRSSRLLIDGDLDDEKLVEIISFDEFVKFDEDQNNESEENTSNVLANDTSITIKIPNKNSVTDNVLGDDLGGQTDDAFSDNASDITVLNNKKKTRNPSQVTNKKLPLPSESSPIYNDEFADLTNLGLVVFPFEIIVKSTFIKMLYLENNFLTELPGELFITLEHLKWLDVRNNRLKSLPPSVKNHPALETFLLDGNEIDEIPLELCTIPNLRILHIAQNPIIDPPKNIVSLGFDGVIDYLRTQWNLSHPEELVNFPRSDVDKPLVFKCNTLMDNEESKVLQKKFSGIRYHELCNKKFLIGRKPYKPNNRCSQIDSAKEQRLIWISRVKNALIKQSSILQRMKNKTTLMEWRHDQKSSNKSKRKIEHRNKNDAPFAHDINSNRESRTKCKNAKRQYKSLNLNDKMFEIDKAFQKMQLSTYLENVTPRSKQQLLLREIEKITDMQSEINDLKRYNDITIT